MTIYHCMIDLKSDARALQFAAALDAWMTHLCDAALITDWRLLRRKLNLVGPAGCDFLLEITLTDMAQLDRAFAHLGGADDRAVRLYEQMHQHIARADMSLYRPFPDAARVERLAIV